MSSIYFNKYKYKCKLKNTPDTKRNLISYLFIVFTVYYVQLLFIKQMDQEHTPTELSTCYFKKVDGKPGKIININEGKAKTKKVVLLFVTSVSLFFLSNNNMINPLNLNWIISVCIGAWGFGLFSKMDDLRVSFTESSIKKQWTPITWVVILTLGIFVSFFTIFNMYNSYNCDKFKFLLKIGIICLPIIYQIILKHTTKNVKTQIHHGMLAYMLALFASQNNVISVVSNGICTGIFIQSIANYGASSLTLS